MSNVNEFMEINDQKKTQKIKITSRDGEEFLVDKEVAFKSELIKKMMEFTEEGDMEVPVSNYDGKTVKKILEYCEKHRNEEYKPKGEFEDPRIQLTDSDKEYMDVDSGELVELLQAANFLHIPGIIDIVTQKIALMAVGKTVEQLREIFDLKNDFTKQEENEIKERFAWVEA